MKKQLFSVGTGLLCLLLTINAHAQLSIGLSGGYARNHLYTSVGYRTYTQYQPADGFSLSVPLKYTVNDWLAVQAEAQFVQKNYQLIRSEFFEGIYNATTNQYLQLPLMGHFSFGGRKLKGFVNLGGYAGYWATSTNKGVAAGLSLQPTENPQRYLDFYQNIAYDEPYAFDNRKDRRFELGWLTGLGVSYQLSRYNVFVEGRYSQAILDQQKNYMNNQIPRYNQTYILQIGCFYQLNSNH